MSGFDRRSHYGCLLRACRTAMFAVVTVLLSLNVHAQSATATLTGTIVDDSHAVVADVEVSVVDVATGFERTTRTSDRGEFVLSLLPPARYQLTALRDGFAPLQVSDVVLNVNDRIALALTLSVAKVGEAVTVVAEPSRVRTSSAVSTVIDRQFVENLPLNGRSFQSLITLAPGVVTVPTSSAAGGQMSVNGQRASANSFSVDGVSANIGAYPGTTGPQTGGNTPGLTVSGTTQSLLSVDALQEFKIQTSTYAAEYGRQPGGQISIVTRSGTNQFHGSLFDYVRNDVFDANDWFANQTNQPKPPERQHDFGGTVGGPLVMPGVYDGRNRSFFFVSYEGLRLRLPKVARTNVPSLALRQQAASGMQPILNAFPLPNGADFGNGLAEFTASYADPATIDATSVRIDQAVNDNLRLFARYSSTPSENALRSNANANQLSRNYLAARSLTLGVTTVLAAHATNEIRINYSENVARGSNAIGDFGGAVLPERSVLIPSAFDSDSASTQIIFSLPGATSTPLLSMSTFDSTQRQFNLVETFSYVTGSHVIKAGADYRTLMPVSELASYSINAQFLSQESILRGIPTSTSIIARISPLKPSFLNSSVYVQDTWRLSPRMTVDFGVRWEVNPAPSERNDRNALAVTETNDLSTMQAVPLGTRAWKTTYDNVASRLGAAYQLSREPGRETILRGGFGVFYDTGNDLAAQYASGGYPYTSSRIATNVGYPLSSTQVVPPPTPIESGLTPPYPLVFIFDPTLELPYTLQWSVAVERAIGQKQSATISYVAAAGRRLLQQTQVNLSAINPAFTNVSLTRNHASSDYQSLQLQFQRRLSRGFSALGSYTWSHTIDDDSNSNTNRVARRGNASFDVRHLLAAAATYAIPAPSSHRISRAVFGSWSLDATLHAQSGVPVDLAAGAIVNPVDGSLTFVRPDVVPGVPFYLSGADCAASNGGVSCPGGRRINPAAFRAPAAGQSGNLGRNVLRGTGAWQVDAALTRDVKVAGAVRLQLRAESFNIFNHPNFGFVQTSLTAPNFGLPTTMLGRQLGGLASLYQIGGPRSFQFALKLLF
jgi:Carboxypeptidase regulatory-like domain